jgi:hypothetical protein
LTRARGRRRPPEGWVALVVLMLLPCLSRSVRASPSAELVIIVGPSNASVETRQSLNRIKDELAADKFAAVIAAPAVDSEPGAVIGIGPGDAQRGALITLFGAPETGEAELCVIRRLGERSAVRRAVVIDLPERMPQALSLRALELLRATAFELSMGPSAPPSVAPLARESRAVPRPSGPDPDRASEAPSPLALDLGVGLWQSLGGPPPAVAPLARLRYGINGCMAARLSAMGLGTHSRMRDTRGTATVTQDVVLLELVFAPGAQQRLKPLASAGAGVLHVSVAGVGVAPYEGRDARKWSSVVDAGVGVALALRSHAALVAELHAFLASPRPVVHFADSSAATIGYPSLILTLALQVSP